MYNCPQTFHNNSQWLKKARISTGQYGVVIRKLYILNANSRRQRGVVNDADKRVSEATAYFSCVHYSQRIKPNIIVSSRGEPGQRSRLRLDRTLNNLSIILALA